MEKEKLNEIEVRIGQIQEQIDSLRLLLEELKNGPETEFEVKPAVSAGPVDIMLDEPVPEPEPEPEAEPDEPVPETEPEPEAEPEPVPHQSKRIDMVPLDEDTMDIRI